MPIIEKKQGLSVKEQLNKWYQNIPNLYHGSFRKRWIKALQRKGMRSAITAKCQDCMCWQNPELQQCNIVICPLWQYRPFRDKKGKIEAEVIAIVKKIDKNEGKRDG